MLLEIPKYVFNEFQSIFQIHNVSTPPIKLTSQLLRMITKLDTHGDSVNSTSHFKLTINILINYGIMAAGNDEFAALL